VKHGTPAHPKMHDLSERIKMPLFAAVGIMESLWHYAGDFSPRGDIGRASETAIARALDWRKKPADLLVALVESKWLDEDPEHKLIVHDWPDHAQDWVKKKLARMKPVRTVDWLPVYGQSLYSVGTLSRQKPDIVGLHAGQGLGLGSGVVAQGSAEGGEMRPEFDDQWQAFKKSYWLAGANLIEEDFTRAHHVWRVMDFEQRTLALDGIRLRVAANQWDDPQFIPKPEKYLREEYKRKVIPRKRPQSAAEELASL